MSQKWIKKIFTSATECLVFPDQQSIFIIKLMINDFSCVFIQAWQFVLEVRKKLWSSGYLSEFGTHPALILVPSLPDILLKVCVLSPDIGILAAVWSILVMAAATFSSFSRSPDDYKKTNYRNELNCKPVFTPGSLAHSEYRHPIWSHSWCK